MIRVGDETKQTCTLKNKGKYEISYNFYFEPVENSPFKLHQIFNVTPNKGTLIQNDRPTQVQVTFRTRDEITIRDLPILKCQVPVHFYCFSLVFKFHQYYQNLLVGAAGQKIFALFDFLKFLCCPIIVGDIYSLHSIIFSNRYRKYYHRCRCVPPPT